MKRLKNFLLVVFFSLFIFTACSHTVTNADLKTNDWLVGEPEDGISMIASFTDDVLTFKFETAAIETSTDETVTDLEQIGQEFARALTENLTFNLDYTLNGDTITIQNVGSENETTAYIVTKDDKSLLFTPVEKNSDAEVLTLVPHVSVDD